MIDRTICLLLAILFSTSITAISALPGAQSQTKPTEQNEAVRLRTELVQVQIVVTDKQGRLIGDLIYSIDVKGLEAAAEFDASRRGVTGGSTIIGRLSSYMSASAKDRQDGINALAQDTGGKAFFNTNDLRGALQKAIDLNRTCYTLAYYPPDDKGNKEFRRITVRVKTHPEYNVRAQKGYFASDLKKTEEKELAQSPQQRLLTAIAKPLPRA